MLSVSGSTSTDKAGAVRHTKVHTLEMNEVCEWQNPLKINTVQKVDPGGHAYQISCGIQLFFFSVAPFHGVCAVFLLYKEAET